MKEQPSSSLAREMKFTNKKRQEIDFTHEKFRKILIKFEAFKTYAKLLERKAGFHKKSNHLKKV